MEVVRGFYGGRCGRTSGSHPLTCQRKNKSHTRATVLISKSSMAKLTRKVDHVIWRVQSSSAHEYHRKNTELFVIGICYSLLYPH